jgi:hypothetical protein
MEPNAGDVRALQCKVENPHHQQRTAAADQNNRLPAAMPLANFITNGAAPSGDTLHRMLAAAAAGVTWIPPPQWVRRANAEGHGLQVLIIFRSSRGYLVCGALGLVTGPASPAASSSSCSTDALPEPANNSTCSV